MSSTLFHIAVKRNSFFPRCLAPLSHYNVSTMSFRKDDLTGHYTNFLLKNLLAAYSDSNRFQNTLKVESFDRIHVLDISRTKFYSISMEFHGLYIMQPFLSLPLEFTSFCMTTCIKYKKLQNQKTHKTTKRPQNHKTTTKPQDHKITNHLTTQPYNHKTSPDYRRQVPLFRLK